MKQKAASTTIQMEENQNLKTITALLLLAACQRKQEVLSTDLNNHTKKQKGD